MDAEQKPETRINASQKRSIGIAVVFVCAGLYLGFSARDYYEALRKNIGTQAIREAIASGELVRTSELRLRGIPKNINR